MGLHFIKILLFLPQKALNFELTLRSSGTHVQRIILFGQRRRASPQIWDLCLVLQQLLLIEYTSLPLPNTVKKHTWRENGHKTCLMLIRGVSKHPLGCGICRNMEHNEDLAGPHHLATLQKAKVLLRWQQYRLARHACHYIFLHARETTTTTTTQSAFWFTCCVAAKNSTEVHTTYFNAQLFGA